MSSPSTSSRGSGSAPTKPDDAETKPDPRSDAAPAESTTPKLSLADVEKGLPLLILAGTYQNRQLRHTLPALCEQYGLDHDKVAELLTALPRLS